LAISASTPFFDFYFYLNNHQISKDTNWQKLPVWNPIEFPNEECNQLGFTSEMTYKQINLQALSSQRFGSYDKEMFNHLSTLNKVYNNTNSIKNAYSLFLLSSENNVSGQENKRICNREGIY
jgi:hypothetical protein